ncbi:MAG: amidase [Acetobacteraceae bacterium]|nr:amidase [Acetobacteraceae bacterium]
MNAPLPANAPSAEDPVGAFIPGPRARSAGGAGPLAGVRLAVKDLFDVAGCPTTYGHPDWARTHPLATGTAPVVAALLEAGAELVGKTKTVELAFGLTGENVWHGTPLNPAAPDRFPGGSSCGSAAAVAGGLADAALGSDTGGSVRIPASYCGLYGLRPSYGALSLAGACALAPSFDTAGWFTRDAELMARVGRVLLPGGGEGMMGSLLRVEEAWEGADPAVADALGPALAQVEARLGPALPVQLVPEGVDTLYAAFRTLQAEEVWATLGSWITATQPRFGPGVAERFEYASRVPPDEAKRARGIRVTVQARLRPLLAGGAVLVLPTSPCPAPLLTASAAEQDRVRARTVGVTAIAGLAGCPELTLPLGRVDGAPVGLSLVAAPGRDRALLALLEAL